MKKILYFLLFFVVNQFCIYADSLPFATSNIYRSITLLISTDISVVCISGGGTRDLAIFGPGYNPCYWVKWDNEAIIGTTFTVTLSAGDYLLGSDRCDANWSVSLPSTYQLIVNNGTGSGSFASGTNCPISPTVPQGKVFDKWTVSGCSLNSFDIVESNSIIMPSSACSVTATFKDPPAGTYLLTVIGGTGTGYYASGALVFIAPTIPEGSTFVQWSVSGCSLRLSAYVAANSIMMPANDCTVDSGLGGGAGTGLVDQDNDVPSINAMSSAIVNAINAAVTSIHMEFSSLQENLSSNFSTFITAIHNEFSSLQESLSNNFQSVVNSVNGVKSSVDAVESAVNQVYDSVNEVKSSVDFVNSTLGEVKSSVNAVKDAIYVTNIKIDGIKSDTEKLVINTDPIPELLPYMSQNLEDINSKMDDLKTNTDPIPELLPYISQNLEDINTNSGLIYASMTELKTTVDLIQLDTKKTADNSDTMVSTLARMEDLLKKINSALYSQDSNVPQINVPQINISASEKHGLPLFSDHTELTPGVNDFKPGFTDDMKTKINELKNSPEGTLNDWVLPLSSIWAGLEDISFNFSGTGAYPIFEELRLMCRGAMSVIIWLLGIFQWFSIMKSLFTVS